MCRFQNIQYRQWAFVFSAANHVMKKKRFALNKRWKLQTSINRRMVTWDDTECTTYLMFILSSACSILDFQSLAPYLITISLTVFISWLGFIGSAIVSVEVKLRKTWLQSVLELYSNNTLKYTYTCTTAIGHSAQFYQDRVALSIWQLNYLYFILYVNSQV